MAFPNTNTTDKSTQIIPEVMQAMIQARLPKAIKFTQLAEVDKSLVGVPGDTITVPTWKYIGDAVDFAEGEKIDYSKLTTDKTTTTIKRAGKGVEISDFAQLVALGDPITEGARQLALSIGSKVDNDCFDTLLNAKLSVEHPAADLDLFDTIEATFEDDTGEHNTEDENPARGTLFVNMKDWAKLRKAVANEFTRASDLGDQILMSGTLGAVLGWQIVTSRKVAVGTYLAVKPGALGINLKRDMQVETGRDMDTKTTKINADEYYGVWLRNESRALVVNKPAAEG